MLVGVSPKAEKVSISPKVKEMAYIFTPVEAEGKGNFLNTKVLWLSLKSLMDAFKGFKVDQVEIWASAGVEEGGLTKLLISAKGEGGIKILFKPQK